MLTELAAGVVALAVQGDRNAIEALLASVSPFIRHMLFRLAGASELDDLQQTVLVKIAMHIGGYKGGDSGIKSWAGQVCVNVTRDYFRGKKAMLSLDDEHERGFEPASETDLEADLMQRDELRRCQRALAQLSPSQRVVFSLRIGMGYSIDEVAKLTRSAQSTTRMRLYYARKAFFRALAREQKDAEEP